MKQVYTFVIISLLANNLLMSQRQSNPLSDFRWTVDSEVLMKIENDSTYSYDPRQLFHVDQKAGGEFQAEFVYYPVNLGEDYIVDIQSTNENTMENAPVDSVKHVNTLWSSLHYTLGGGWVHFANCMLYALEREYVELTAPLMKRPESKWKPDPPTESYLRTKKWDYYVPVSQRYAQKEYEIRKENNELGDLNNLPESFIQLFLETNNREYGKMKEANKEHDLAKIDLVKILLGANYLGEAQISYISNNVLKAVKNYTISKIPSVLIFDQYDAAVAMKLDKNGYVIQKVAFKEGADVTVEEAEQRTEEIRNIVQKINTYNNQAFQKRLKSYYGK